MAHRTSYERNRKDREREVNKMPSLFHELFKSSAVDRLILMQFSNGGSESCMEDTGRHTRDAGSAGVTGKIKNENEEAWG